MSIKTTAKFLIDVEILEVSLSKWKTQLECSSNAVLILFWISYPMEYTKNLNLKFFFLKIRNINIWKENQIIHIKCYYWPLGPRQQRW